MLVNQLLDGNRPDNIRICILVRQRSTFLIADTDNILLYLEAFEKCGFQQAISENINCHTESQHEVNPDIEV